MAAKMLRELKAELEETQQQVEWEKRRYAARESMLKKPENIFLLFEEVNVPPEALSARRIQCGWCDPARGYRACAEPATDVLPRPAIFVCVAHREEWNARVEEANTEAAGGGFGGGEAHKKRIRVE